MDEEETLEQNLRKHETNLNYIPKGAFGWGRLKPLIGLLGVWKECAEDASEHIFYELAIKEYNKKNNTNISSTEISKKYAVRSLIHSGELTIATAITFGTVYGLDKLYHLIKNQF